MRRSDLLKYILISGKIEAGGKGMIEDETFGCHYQLDGHESEQVLGGGDGQESLGYCSFMGSQRVRHDWMTGLNWTELIAKVLKFSPERHSKYYELKCYCRSTNYTNKLWMGSISPLFFLFKEKSTWIEWLNQWFMEVHPLSVLRMSGNTLSVI